MNYHKVDDTFLKCIISDIEQKDGFVVIKFCSSRNKKFYISKVLDNQYVTEALYNDMTKKKVHSVHRYKIAFEKPTCRILRWDDVHRGRCSSEIVNEIERDNKGQPRRFKCVIVYANLDETLNPNLDTIIQNDFISEDSSYFKKILKFNSLEEFNSRKGL